MNGWEKLLNWEHIWFDLVQEDIRRNIRDGASYKEKDEDKFALVGKGKKGKWKKSQTKPKCSQGGKKKDLSKRKVFNFHEFMHYFINCPQKIEEKITQEEEKVKP